MGCVWHQEQWRAWVFLAFPCLLCNMLIALLFNSIDALDAISGPCFHKTTAQLRLVGALWLHWAQPQLQQGQPEQQLRATSMWLLKVSKEEMPQAACASACPPQHRSGWGTYGRPHFVAWSWLKAYALCPPTPCCWRRGRTWSCGWASGRSYCREDGTQEAQAPHIYWQQWTWCSQDPSVFYPLPAGQDWDGPIV